MTEGKENRLIGFAYGILTAVIFTVLVKLYYIIIG